ncbi:MAG: hypothetical protein JXA25_15730 [Anaerolineales bacterium]|nr:hypothetical protein [Anaerolineales bacterium]
MTGFLKDPLSPTMFPPHSDMRTLAGFRRTMSDGDQQLLDELLGTVDQHWPFEQSAAHLTRLDLLLLTMVVEQHKRLKQLEGCAS